MAAKSTAESDAVALRRELASAKKQVGAVTMRHQQKEASKTTAMQQRATAAEQEVVTLQASGVQPFCLPRALSTPCVDTRCCSAQNSPRLLLEC